MHIVLVEPSSLGRRHLTQLLERRGHRVDAFDEAEAALQFILSEQTIDLVLTNFETDGISGMELCWQCRLMSQEGRYIYIIAMSSSTDASKSIEALDSGADDFIRKPPVAEELYARVRAAERLKAMHDQLVYMATRDALTGLFNRRAFFEYAERQLAESAAAERISVLQIDIDRFKTINDTYGHAAGDAAIQMVSNVLNRYDHLCGRLGGEEFAVLMLGFDADQAFRFAEGVRAKLQSTRLKYEDEMLSLTASFGVCEITRSENETISAALRRADAALYKAKRLGRNRVVQASGDIHGAVAAG